MPPRKTAWWSALRKGADATVKGVSAKGTESIDVFPLKGLAQAPRQAGAGVPAVGRFAGLENAEKSKL